MYISQYFVPFSCQMVVMEGVTYHIIRSYFKPEVYKLYQCAMPFTAESNWGGREGWEKVASPPATDRLLSYISTHQAITKH